MGASKKLAFAAIVFLIALALVSVFANFANATDTLTFQASQSASNLAVNEKSTYTFTINNTGASNLGDLNMTVPLGYALNVGNLAVSQQPSGQSWAITSQSREIQKGVNVTEILLTGSGQGLATGQSLAFTFTVTNPQVAGTYTWNIGANNDTSFEALNSSLSTQQVTSNLAITSILPALAILGIAFGIALLNSGLNRFLINYFIGWEQYRVMQKEMAEYRSETMAAARANDKKQMEKLKKKQSQINSMQAKMLKPQLVQFGISFVYIIVWILVLTPTFQNTSLAYLPGFGPIPVFYLYPILSFFLGLVASRIIGIMPIEN